MLTLAIIKPDAVAAGKLGAILAHLEREGFVVRASRLARLSRGEAEAFYEVHKERPFYQSLVSFMTSGPCFPMVLERDDAISHWRNTMGATDSTKAEEGTLRNQFGTDIQFNACHGSDAPETAAEEISYFFGGIELI